MLIMTIIIPTLGFQAFYIQSDTFKLSIQYGDTLQLFLNHLKA
jgi:hypothetical protein